MILELIFATVVLGFLLNVLMYKILSKRFPKKKKELRPVDLLPSKKKGTQWFNKVTQKLYVSMMRIPILKNYVLKIRIRLEAINSYDEYSIRKETAKIVAAVLIIAISLILLMIIFSRSYVAVFWLTLGLIFLNGVFVDFFIHRLEDRMLRELQTFITALRHRFQHLKVVDEAMYEAAQVSSFEMKLQAERIYEVLISTEIKEKLSEYEDTAPNRFLKALAAISVMVMEQGDRKTDKGSVYLNGLAGISRELNFEVSRRTQLNWVLKGLSVLTVVPVFFAIPIKTWATTYFPVMIDFYQNRIGLFLEIIVYVTLVICYLLIRKMREIQESKYTVGVKRNPLVKRVYEVRFIKKFVDLFVPSYHEKQYYKQTILLKEANSPLKVEWLTLQRLSLVVSAFLIFIGFILYSNHVKTNNILFSPTSLNAFGLMDEQQLGEALELTAYDREMIDHLKEVRITDRQDVIETVSEDLGIDPGDSLAIVTGNRIHNKILNLENTYLKWWELVVGAALAYVAYYIPIGLLHFQRFFRKREMEEEVHQFNTIISVLSKFDRITVYEIVEWMERFSVMFKDPLRRTILTYDSGPEEALSQLKKDVSFPAFTRTVDRLVLAVNRISIEEAFEDLDIEQQFHTEQRDHYNKRMIENKKLWGNMIGLTPIIVLVIFYLVVPLIWVSIQNLNQTIFNLTS
ncbi:Membrane protein, putative transporter (plasmid) [Alkalihalophilus pseudofirmus OF4]|uniref:Membrane protein, putative transporter n=1 Tax=Alkalihalophilus pseudofirmus (strain ATCC BAA-2126 / JCM 17055 / OF4) TaxID=398511 RepID=D3G1J4_ALKPO|nr:hypothetical protein [Alkalihalophilus pseudofirmus]ADC52220.1 Membrane protein, putative transporter [Alkalihalophilus pseudofirmus OF4]